MADWIRFAIERKLRLIGVYASSSSLHTDSNAVPAICFRAKHADWWPRGHDLRNYSVSGNLRLQYQRDASAAPAPSITCEVNNRLLCVVATKVHERGEVSCRFAFIGPQTSYIVLKESSQRALLSSGTRAHSE
jgi:hypothetical protein